MSGRATIDITREPRRSSRISYSAKKFAVAIHPSPTHHYFLDSKKGRRFFFGPSDAGPHLKLSIATPGRVSAGVKPKMRP